MIELNAEIACIFSLVHNSALAQANTIAWVLGVSTGAGFAGLLATRYRPTPHDSPGSANS